MVLRHTGAYRERPPAQPLGHERSSDPLGERHRTLEIRPGQNREKLFSAEAGGQVHASRGMGQDVRKGLQGFVACGVAVAVVVFLEAVQVEKDHTQQAPTLGGGEFIF